jgi:hypothetical protein
VVIFIGMGRRILITEQQLTNLVSYINESEEYNHLLKRIYNDLKMNYEPAVASVSDGIEYSLQSLVSKKVDGEKATLESVKNYLCAKNIDLNPEFVGQVIYDWYYGNINDKNLQLSRNVKFTR